MIAAVCLLGAAATAAEAASVRDLHIADFKAGAVASARAAEAAFLAGSDLAVFGQGGLLGAKSGIVARRSEDFSGFKAWDGTSGTSNPTTAVGSFTSLGGTGVGHSAINGGTALEVRSGSSAWGRFAAAKDGNAWLDSNDTLGMRWEVGGLARFNALSFFLTDVADVGAKFSLTIGGTLYEHVIGASGKTANGTIHWVRILLDDFVDSLVVELRHDRLNDGFGIDGLTIAEIAPVPVPPALLLVLTGGLALAGLGRRRRAA